MLITVSEQHQLGIRTMKPETFFKHDICLVRVQGCRATYRISPWLAFHLREHGEIVTDCGRTETWDYPVSDTPIVRSDPLMRVWDASEAVRAPNVVRMPQFAHERRQRNVDVYALRK